MDVKVNIKALGASKVDPETCYIGTDKKKILVLKNLEVQREFDIEAEPTSLDISNKDELLFYGDKVTILSFLLLNSKGWVYSRCEY